MSTVPPDGDEIGHVARLSLADFVRVRRMPVSDPFKCAWSRLGQWLILHVAFVVVWHFLSRMRQMLDIRFRRSRRDEHNLRSTNW